MLFISLLTLIVAIPLYTYRITPYTYIRITTIVLIYSALLAFNSFYIDSIQSGISIYSGLFQVTTISQRIEIFIYIVGSCILFGIFFSDEKKTRIESYNNHNKTRSIMPIKNNKMESSEVITSSYVPTYNAVSYKHLDVYKRQFLFVIGLLCFYHKPTTC